MHKKSFTFGLGVGVLVITVLLYGAYSLQRGWHERALDNARDAAWMAGYNEAVPERYEIIQMATDIGMGFRPEFAPSAYEIIQMATEMGMVFQDAHDVPQERENENGDEMD